MNLRPLLVYAAMAGALAGCATGPVAPTALLAQPAAWRLDAADTYWQPAAPAHAAIDPSWWRTFGDSELDTLEQQALANNQTVKIIAARYEQAKATLASVAAARWPMFDIAGSVAREKISADRPLSNYGMPNSSTVQNNLQIGASVSYEVDLFGRIQHTVEAARATTQQARDDFANARLVLTADLATQYWTVRALDAEIDVLNRAVALQHKALDFVTARHQFGAVSGLDVLQQQAQLDTTRTQAQLLLNQRAQHEDALATLLGTPAPSFTLAPKRVPLIAPVLPTGVPSDVLQRRPDIAAAERAMAAANARIGVARAAYFPQLTLAPEIGWNATRLASLFSVPSLLWSLGASISQPLFAGGRLRAHVDYARADYAAAQANYRQTVLTAFQEVQNAVTGLSVLNEAEQRAQAAVSDAQQLVALANARYAGGLTPFIDVLNAEQQWLASERQQVQIRGQQTTLVVYLAKALGGGWNTADLATADSPPSG